MKLWEKLTIETEYTSVKDCIIGMNGATSSKDSSKFWRKGIIGSMSSEGEFNLVLYRGRYKEYQYVGKVLYFKDKVVLDGIVKPKKHIEALLKFGSLFYIIAMFSQELKYVLNHSFVEIIRQLPSALGFFIAFPVFLYIILRINVNITARKIKGRFEVKLTN